MKKILGISLVALFAVAPFAADATLTSKGYVDAKLAEKQNAATAVTHTANIAVGSAKVPVYVGTNGAVVAGDELKALAYKDSLGTSDITGLDAALAAKEAAANKFTKGTSTDTQLDSRIEGAQKDVSFPTIAVAERIAQNEAAKVVTSNVTGQITDLTGRMEKVEGNDGVAGLWDAVGGLGEDKQDKIAAGTLGNVVTYSGEEGTVGSLGFDTAPTASSNNLVKSGAIKTYVDNAVAGKDTLSELTDTTITNAQNGQILKYNGTAWVNGTEYSYTLPTASNTVKGGVTVDNSTITADANGQISVGTIGAGKVTGLAAVATGGKFNDLTDKPTTVSGYGITDAYTKAQVDALPAVASGITATKVGQYDAYATNKADASALTTLENSLGALAHLHIPANCETPAANCVLVYKGSENGFVLEDVERASSTETDGQTDKLSVEPVTSK